MSNTQPFIFADSALARRLERAEARSNADFVEARARAFPESGAEWIEVAGAYAMFDGPKSPLTQSFGLGLFDEVTEAHLEKLESFFSERGASVFHEVSPLAEPSLLGILNKRNYRPIEFTTVMFRSIQRGVSFADARNPDIRVRRASGDELHIWARTAARGWGEFPELEEFILGLSKLNAQKSDGLSFLAELHGHPIATGSMSICEGVALLAGASTVPEARKQGAQLALLDSRLRYAAENGCDLAMMCSLPGTASQRNAERQGFRIAYTRIKWKLMNE
jgi:hypothetical protein